MRWQDEARFGLDDVHRKVDEIEEARAADRRELRKEMVKRSDELHAGQVDGKKEMDLLRAMVAGKGSGPAAVGQSETVRSLEGTVGTLSDRLDRLDMIMRRSPPDGGGGGGGGAAGDARLSKLHTQVLLIQDQLDSVCASEAHIPAMRRDIASLQVDVERNGTLLSQCQASARQQEQLLVDARKGAAALCERVASAEARAEREGGLIAKASTNAERAQSTVQEVVQVVGAMSQRIAAGAAGGGDVERVHDRVGQLQAIYEARFRDISVMLRHLGMSVKTHGAKESDSETQSDVAGGGGVARGVTKTIFEEIRRVKGELGGEVDGIRALAHKAMGADTTSLQLQEAVDGLVGEMGAFPFSRRGFISGVCLPSGTLLGCESIGCLVGVEREPATDMPRSIYLSRS